MMPSATTGAPDMEVCRCPPGMAMMGTPAYCMPNPAAAGPGVPGVPNTQPNTHPSTAPALGPNH